jgi:two-component system cell cycle response regulator DivK
MPTTVTTRSAPLILLVEDDPDTREMYAFALTRDGLSVLAAEDGHEGLRLASEVQPDVIVTDVSLPGLDGFALAKRVRADARTALTPILGLTGWAGTPEAQRACADGCLTVLGKPCPPDMLISHIRHALSTRAELNRLPAPPVCDPGAASFAG